MTAFPSSLPSDPEFAHPQGDFRVVSCVEDTAPAEEPITLDEAKNHLRVDVNDDDVLIGGLLVAARKFVEDATGRAFITRSFSCTLDAFPSRGIINLPRTRVTAVTLVQYTDENGATQLVDPAVYAVDLKTEPARIYVKFGQVWPAMIPQPSAVKVSFTAGEANAAAVDKRDVAAIKLVLGHLYENREAGVVGTIASVLPLGLRTILGQRRVPVFA